MLKFIGWCNAQKQDSVNCIGNTQVLFVNVPHCYFEQWGSGAPGTITYPIEFTSAFIAIATPANGSPNEIGITNLKTNSFHVENWSSSRPAYNDYWIAIGI